MHTGTGPTNESNDLAASYLERIDWLRNDGVHDRITMNESSVRDLRAFVNAASYTRRASLALHERTARTPWTECAPGFEAQLRGRPTDAAREWPS